MLSKAKWPDRALRMAIGLALGVGSLAAGIGTAEADFSPSVTVGAGLQTNFYACDKGCIDSPGTVAAGDTTVDGFALDSIRLYVNGTVTDQIKFTFNTEYTGSGTNTVGVLDAIGRFEFSDKVNIWAGRFLPPSDRANLYGPYYANDWAPYSDGVADFYPDVATGRDNGVAYWGQFGILKVQVGAFDGESLNSAVKNKSNVLSAARLTLDFWDPEPGYYLNGTYYGDKNILSLGAVAQNQDGKTAWNLDGLMERKLPNLGVVSVEAEYLKDNGLTSATPSDGWYGLGSYLFPQVVGIGKFQILGKYSQKTVDATATQPSDDKIKTAEADLNYVIKAFNARVGLYFLNQSDHLLDASKKEYGLKLQLQI